MSEHSLHSDKKDYDERSCGRVRKRRSSVSSDDDALREDDDSFRREKSSVSSSSFSSCSSSASSSSSSSSSSFRSLSALPSSSSSASLPAERKDDDVDEKKTTDPMTDASGRKKRILKTRKQRLGDTKTSDGRKRLFGGLLGVLKSESANAAGTADAEKQKRRAELMAQADARIAAQRVAANEASL